MSTDSYTATPDELAELFDATEVLVIYRDDDGTSVWENAWMPNSAVAELGLMTHAEMRCASNAGSELDEPSDDEW